MTKVLLIMTALLALVHAGWAADLTQQVPLDAPAYPQLRILLRGGMLADARQEIRNNLLLPAPLAPVTRYDIAVLLTEPLEQFAALVEVQEIAPSAATLAQRRRTEIAMKALSVLPAAEFNGVLAATRELITNYRDAIEELSPGLCAQAERALQKLAQPQYRPWLKPAASNAGDSELTTRWWVRPTSPDALRDPLLASPSRPAAPGDPSAPPVAAGIESIAAGRPINSFAAAVDVAVGERFRIYGEIASLPGQDVTRGEGGKARVGIEVTLARISALGISGIFEYSVSRSGDPDAPVTSTGAATGFGISW